MIPNELKQLHNWVCVHNNKKIPMKAWTYEAASSSDPLTWSDYANAEHSVNLGYYDYLGFAFDGTGYIGIDIDCGKDEFDLMSTTASDIIKHCKSYTEESKSGRGYHIIIKGDLPFNGKNNQKGVEIYKTKRFFIMTGKTIIFKDIIKNQDAIDYVVDKYFKETERNNSDDSFNHFKIYTPKWENCIKGKKILLEPEYPKIKNGCRNISLTSLAGSMHITGYEKSQIYQKLLYVNDVACIPKLPITEIQNICDSICKYRR